jgi:hypothetical protein
MKKLSLLFISGALLSLASCTSETHTSGASDAEIDSIVNARVEEIRLDMMRSNDSLINAMAAMRADSIIAAMKGGNTVTTKSTTTRTTTVGKKPGTAQASPSAEPAKPATPNSQTKWDQNQQGTSSQSKWGNQEPSKEPSSQSKWGK